MAQGHIPEGLLRTQQSARFVVHHHDPAIHILDNHAIGDSFKNASPLGNLAPLLPDFLAQSVLSLLDIIGILIQRVAGSADFYSGKVLRASAGGAAGTAAGAGWIPLPLADGTTPR